jgi:hypothetical protein
VISSAHLSVSGVQLGSRGVWAGRAFEVIGALQVLRSDVWHFWHLRFEDASTGWFVETVDRFFVGQVRPAPAAPGAESLKLGQTFHYEAGEGVVTALSPGTPLGSHGQVPFASASAEAMFVEVRSGTGEGAIVDYSAQPARVFVGHWCSLRQLSLSALHTAGEDEQRTAREVPCTGCGATLALRQPHLAQTLVCAACGAQMDLAVGDSLTCVEAGSGEYEFHATLDPGSRGTWNGADWTCLGYIHRFSRIKGTVRVWDEYLLHSPGRGLCWLTENEGHWTWWEPLAEVPTRHGHPVGRPKTETVDWGGAAFRHYRRRHWEVQQLAGEFPWRVRPTNQSRVDEYVSPPHSLACELRHDQVLWRRGTWMSPHDVREIWQLSGPLPAGVGTSPCQPNPHVRVTGRLKLYGAAVLLCALCLPLVQGGSAVTITRTLSHPQRAAKAFRLELPARNNDLEVEVKSANLLEASAFVVVRFKSLATGSEHVGGFNLHSYRPRYPDGRPAVAVPRDSQRSVTHRLTGMPGGAYRVTVEGECEPPQRKYDYRVTLRSSPVHDSSRFRWLVAVGALPLLWGVWARRAFEKSRWRRSDYA